MATLAELVKAENAADAQRRAFGCMPDHQRQPGAVRDAYARWEAAHKALAEARAAAAETEAGS
jgi:hypothetical protein